MNKKNINRILIIFALILIFTFGYKNFFEQEKLPIVNTKDNTKKYDDISINPNDYEKLEDFLEEKTKKEDYKFDFDISVDDFVFCEKTKTWGTIYTPMYHKYIDEWLFEKKEFKNEAIYNIEKSYNNGCINWWYISPSKHKIIFEEDIAHNNTYLLNDVFSKNKTIDEIIETFDVFQSKSIELEETIAYFNDLKWNYEEANKNRERICKENSVICQKTNNLEFSWIVLDENKNPVENVKITLLNNSTNVLSDINGKFNFTFDYYSFAHLRFKLSKHWYSDWFKAVSFNNSNWKIDKKINWEFYLNKAHYDDLIDIDKDNVVINWKKYFVVKTAQSEYKVPVDWLYNFDWNKFNWNQVKVYMYEFKKTDNIENLVEADTFSGVNGYVWNLMKTFWMPYIQFFDPKTKKELFVYKSNPIILTNNIYHMQELYDNYDWIYEAITKEDMEYLVDYSRIKWWYPITFDFLIENNFLRWPAWWALDRKKWVWEAIDAKVLSVDWKIEAEFYLINDL